MSIERLLEATRALERGDLDAAERTYLAVAEMDPRSTIALMGLARVAMARGTESDLAQAERLASTVLAADPENAAARRLLDEWRARTAPPAEAVTPEQGSMVEDQAAAPAEGSAPPEASNPASPEASAAPETTVEPAGDGDDYPWPDLDEQLERYREHAPGPLSRFLRRRRG